MHHRGKGLEYGITPLSDLRRNAMPVRQVYGKKRATRGGPDPDSIFGYDRSSPEVKISEVAEQIEELRLHHKHDIPDVKTARSKKHVLSPVDGNSLPRQAKADVGNNVKRKGWRKVVVESSDGENEPEGDETPDLSANACGLITYETRKEHHPAEASPREYSPRTSPSTTAPTQASDGQEDIEHCSDLLNLSSHGLTSFQDWAEQLGEHFHLTKIAEASFGEVYRLSLRETLPGFSSSDESVLKIIPLRPSEDSLPLDRRKHTAFAKRMLDMSFTSDVANEVRLLQRMSIIPGFTNFRDVRIVQGRPPSLFQTAYQNFNTAQKARGKESSHFADPMKECSYTSDQLWAVIEMQDAGTDLEQLLESRDCKSIFCVWDIFWQVALSLAKGEEGACFEHRDLHLGNICVSQACTTSLDDSDVRSRKLGFTPVEITIIDYTISRAQLSCGTTAFHDLASPESAGLFDADSTQEYQYDIYRYMRGAVLRDNVYADFSIDSPLASSIENRSWEQFHPVTNLIWLHFVLFKLLEHVAWPSETKAPPRRLKIKHAQWKREIDLEHVLLRVQDVLDPGLLAGNNIGDDLASAGDLIGLALREGWLDAGDVVGEDVTFEQEREGVLVEELTASQLEERASTERHGDKSTFVQQCATRQRRPGGRKP